jgi:hypothetical protein
MYLLAASAAGVAMGSVQGAEATILYTPTHRTLTNGTLPIPIAGTTVFNLTDKFYIITGSWSSQFLSINASGSAAVVGGKSSAYALHRGKIVGPKDRFQSGKRLMAGAFCETQISQSNVFGPFANTTQRYLGLKFKLNGEVHYGWARFAGVKAAACNGGPAVSATLTGYAYETAPNKPIVAGDTGPAVSSSEQADTMISDPAPRRATLGLLALGAIGLSIWKRNQPIEHTSENS